MPAYNFKKEFADAVESGKKCSTIRRDVRGAKVGGTAYLYTGQRTKACRKLGEGVLIGVRQIEILRNDDGDPLAHVNGIAYGLHQLEILARGDGFADGETMVAWFEKQYGTLPFKGFLHEWVLK
jgi:hypothetical protein